MTKHDLSPLTRKELAAEIVAAGGDAKHTEAKPQLLAKAAEVLTDLHARTALQMYGHAKPDTPLTETGVARALDALAQGGKGPDDAAPEASPDPDPLVVNTLAPADPETVAAVARVLVRTPDPAPTAGPDYNEKTDRLACPCGHAYPASQFDSCPSCDIPNPTR